LLLAIVGVAVADGEGLGEDEALTLSARGELELGAELLVGEGFGVGDAVALGLVDAFGVELADAVGDGLDVPLDALATEGPSTETSSNAHPTVAASKYRLRAADFDHLFICGPSPIGPLRTDAPDASHVHSHTAPA
jgi:hypothetical protein